MLLSSVYPHRAGWKFSLTTMGIEFATFGYILYKIVLIYKNFNYSYIGV
jgi:hypothetical protein